MGNLGAYQTMTTLAKRTGGPVVLALGTAVAGWVIGRVGEAGGKAAIRAARTAIRKHDTPTAPTGQEFDVHGDGEDGKGLVPRAGDRYRVLAGDGDALLVEVLGDEDNPYFTSTQFLAAVSDFPDASRRPVD